MTAVKTQVGQNWIRPAYDESGVGVGPWTPYSYIADPLTGNPISPMSAGLGYAASGKTPVVSAFAAPATVTMTIAAPGVISWAAHGLPAGTGIKFATTGALPTGLTAGTEVFVSSAGLASGTFQVADTYAHAIAGTNSITTSGSQSGTQTAYAVHSAFFTPLAGRSFNISAWGTFGGDTVQLERSVDGGVTSLPLTAAGTQLGIWTAAFSESWGEDEVGLLYRINRSVGTAGAISYRISQ